MSFENPTQLRLGMAGTLGGKRYRVVGRVVMGMDDGGETYYWNEFNLVNDAGASATLVYEETERGGEWRLFLLFEPEYPMTAADAATKRVGDRLNLDGTPVGVTLVDESRVYIIEGQAPEGMEIGDVAHYFNAEAGNTMQVVSWTGDEVEYYRGISLARGVVGGAFGIREPSRPAYRQAAATFLSSVDSSDDEGDSMSSFLVKVAGVGLCLFIFIVILNPSCIPRRERPAVVRTKAPASPLQLGMTGRLGGTSYRITSHALVEIAAVGFVYDRHEYQLIDDNGSNALLICGSKPGAKDWLLLSPFDPSTPMSPKEAGMMRSGDKVNLAGIAVTVSELFQSTSRQEESENPQAFVLKTGNVFYGFGGQSGSTIFLVRWNNYGITFHRGKTLPEKEIVAAFK